MNEVNITNLDFVNYRGKCSENQAQPVVLTTITQYAEPDKNTHANKEPL
jgi:hypothetical protein